MTTQPIHASLYGHPSMSIAPKVGEVDPHLKGVEDGLSELSKQSRKNLSDLVVENLDVLTSLNSSQTDKEKAKELIMGR